jgi:ribosomal protein S18 acetylase RimI-like enzyme
MNDEMVRPIARPGVNLRELGASDLQAVADIHLAAFPDAALSQLGREAIRRYYEWQLTGPHQIIALGCENESCLVGFCFAGVFSGAMSGFLSKNKRYLSKRILTHPWLLANPLVRERGLTSLTIIRRTRQVWAKASTPSIQQNDSFGVLAIAVHPKNQARGLGGMMMETVEVYAREKGFRQLGLSVSIVNTQAITFYEKQGWRKVANEDGWTGKMLKDID